MNVDQQIPESDLPQSPGLPRWVEIPFGIFIACFGILSLIGSVGLAINPPPKNPLLAICFGILLLLGTGWVISLAAKLIFGYGQKDGLFAPTTLHILAWAFLLLPIGGLFTGYSRQQPMFAGLQAAAYVSIFFYLRNLANKRSRARA